jgi:lysophospholipase L1-like esterase
VNPVTNQVIRSTEKVLIPERGVMLGNFGASAINPNESWVTDAEYYMGSEPHSSGADNSVFAARVKWSVPNRIADVASRRRIVVLGDSITKGVRTGVTEAETFGALLQASLRTAGHDVDVINQGIGGERTDQAIARLNPDILALEPEIVIVMYGTNDSYIDQGQQNSRLSAEQYQENLKAIVEECNRLGIQPILMTEPRWGDRAGNNGVGEHPNVRLETYVAACRRVAEETQTPLIDHFRVWTDSNSKGTDIGIWTTDQCHPNPAGHSVIADTMLPVVLKAVTR